jgi:hypothetical protein
MISSSKRCRLALRQFFRSITVRRSLISPAAGYVNDTNGTFGRPASSSHTTRLLLTRILPVLLAVIFVAGCETELETGYKPRPLNATSTDRRAYYAPPFTPEAVTTPEEDKPAGGDNFHRPGNY